MSMSPALIQALTVVAQEAAAAGRGGKGAVYAAWCQRLGVSLPTLMRGLAQVRVAPARKRRSDAGDHALTLVQAQALSSVMMEGYRANKKKILTLGEALAKCRANEPGFAEVVDAATGEVALISESACARALRANGLHPSQLRRAAPAQQLASLHPNDVWQIDASISTLYYVPEEGGAQDMDPALYYKNKPGNFERIKRQRLTRYVITDHTSGSIFVLYVAGGESTVNLAEAFLAAIAQRPGQQMYGVPFHLMMDPGSAGTAGAFGNLLRRLQVTPVVNEAGNARAKGQVENAHNLVETSFESGFKFTHVPGIDWINERAAGWMRWYNATKVHSRHGMTRWAKWMQITQQQLRLVAPALARQLLTHAPETPKVDQHLQVRFRGQRWDVRDVPGVMVGEKLSITVNPFDEATAYVVLTDADGHEQLLSVPQVQEGAHNFRAGAPLIGREFRAMPDTLADQNRKLVERLATGADTDAQAEAARKAKALPFGGRFDPYKHHADLPAATALPRRGEALQVATRTADTAAPVVLTHFQAAQALVQRGVAMTPQLVATLKSLHPEGVPEAEIDALVTRLTVRAGLRVVAGGAGAP